MSKQDNKEEFKPYVPASKHPAEFTWVAMVIGAILAIVFGAANAYLGLIVGMTVSASIPAAVISMAVLRIIMKRTSILENNIVQTITSTGESLAAGVFYTAGAIHLAARTEFDDHCDHCTSRRYIRCCIDGSAPPRADCQ